MKFTFTEKRMEPSEELRSYATRKVSKLDKFFKNEAEAYVTFSIERGRFLAEITIHSNGLFYRASELTNDMYASVDSGVAAIERQIRRNKTRLAKRLRTGLDIAAPDTFSVPAEDESDSDIRIVRTKTHHIKPMHPEEAVLQMNLVGHEFYIFLNAETDNTAIVYKRKQGDYGLIDVE